MKFTELYGEACFNKKNGLNTFTTTSLIRIDSDGVKIHRQSDKEKSSGRSSQ